MDISVNVGEHKFNYRVAAIIRHNGKVLLHHCITHNNQTLIGGRVQDGEDSIIALKREIKEEIGIDTEYVKSVAIIENFFRANEQNYHELLMIHEMKFTNEEDYNKDLKPIEENKKDKLEFLWTDLSESRKYIILPKPLESVLNSNNDEFKHIINYDM